MKIIEKLKKHGFTESIRVIRGRCANAVNNAIYYACWVFPVNNKLIVMESEGDLSDNAYALYDYMQSNGYLEKYKVVWLVEDVKNARKREYKNTSFVNKKSGHVEAKKSFVLATCSKYIFDHSNVLSHLYKRLECEVLNLWHGCGFKADKGSTEIPKSDSDKILVTGKLYIEIQKIVFQCSDGKFMDIGYPRNDYLFKEKTSVQVKFKEEFGLDTYNKIFLWMPTYRKSNNMDLSEDYFNSLTGLPIIDDSEKLCTFNDYLTRNNCICIFKIHHLQAELNAFSTNYTNIVVLKDDDIINSGLQLYQVLPLTDCLITDYSSVANDYMLLNKPIIYTIDDYEDYQKSRGFIPENPIKYFVGYHVRDNNQLIRAMGDVFAGNDKYKNERANILSVMHTYPDGEASRRIINYLKL